MSKEEELFQYIVNATKEARTDQWTHSQPALAFALARLTGLIKGLSLITGESEESIRERVQEAATGSQSNAGVS